VIDLLVLLADGDYDSIMERCPASRMTREQLQTAVREWPCKIIAPPADYADFQTYERESAAVPTWAVDADLWTEDEGRSDLTLSMTIAFASIGPVIQIKNLHVL
jgi:hypothetical protein